MSGGDDGDPVASSLQRRYQAGAHERRLAAARGARHREEARSCEAGERGGDVDIPSEELVLVLHAEGLQSAIRAGEARVGRRLAQVERIIMPQDAQLELRELRPGLRAELIGEAFACRPDGRQRVGLAAAPIERGREEHPASFSQRRLPNQPLGVGDGCRVLAEPQASLGPHLLELHSHLVEPLRLHERGRPVPEVDIRSAAPERERALRRIHGTGGVVVEVLTGGCREPVEALRIHAVGVDVQGVCAGRRRDRVASDRVAYPADGRLQLLRPRLRRLVTPEGVGELVGRHRSARSEHQRREHRALPRAERHPLEGERAEHCHAHAPHCSPFPARRQRLAHTAHTDCIPSRDGCIPGGAAVEA